MIEDAGERWLGQLRRGAAEHCVLALLRDGEAYGFDLARVLAEAGLIAGEGTIYPLLSRLRRDGLVETSWRPSALGPPRRYYVLTGRGEQALVRFVREWRPFAAAVDRLLGVQPCEEGSRPYAVPKGS